MAQSQIQEQLPIHNIIYRIIEDGLYQTKIRCQIIENDLVELNLDYYDFKNQQFVVEKRIADALLNDYQQYYISQKYPIESLYICLGNVCLK